ncbi:MAG: AsmA family protein [Acidobacteria bacterium]|nr:AsmA family protein [Acidobacteriota bacterium]
MTRGVRIALIAAGAVLLAGVLLPKLVNVNSFRPMLERELSSALGRAVKVGNLSFSLFSGSLSADDISIADDPAFSQGAFLAAKKFEAGVEVLPLVFGKTLHVTGIRIDAPQIALLKGPGNRWNFATLGSGAAPAAKGEKPAEQALSVDKVEITKGRILVGTANSAEKPYAYEDVSLEVKGFSTSAKFPLEIGAKLPGGGSFDLKGTCGPLKGAAGQVPVEAAIKVKNLDLALSGFVEPATGIQGIADFEGVLASNGQVAKANGTLSAEKLKLASHGSPSAVPVSLKFAVEHRLASDSGQLMLGDVGIGKAAAHITGSYQVQGNATGWNLKLSAPAMPVDEIQAVLPALGVVLPSGSKLEGGTLSADLAVTGSSAAPVVAGAVKLANAKLASFDLASKLAVIPALGGKNTGGRDTTIQDLSANVNSGPDGTQANVIHLALPAFGTITGGGTVSPSGALSFAMNADIAAASGMVQKAGIGGESGVPFLIEGTTSNPKFLPNAKAMAGNAARNAVSGALGGNVSGLGGLFGKKKK